MKTLISIIVMTISVGVFAQEPVVLETETTLINSNEAILIRTAKTPMSVTVLFNVEMKRLICPKYKRTGKTRRCAVKRVLKTTTQPDRIKLNFKQAAVLGGTEHEVFKIKAAQKGIDSENVIYDVQAVETIHPYSIIKKGILGYDSYSIEVK